MVTYMRKRRTAVEAREAILDAAEKRLVKSGPAGIRLQEVAKDVGVSHPTLLHHFGDRDGLVRAVVERALDSLHAEILSALAASGAAPTLTGELIERVHGALSKGHARAFLWLALSGYTTNTEDLRIRSFAEVVHEVRKAKWAETKRKAPPFEDTHFTILLPALALMTLEILDTPAKNAAAFRAWLGKLIHRQLEQGP